MLKINELLNSLEKLAPLSISLSAIEGGSYDNSGIIVKSKDDVNSVLFTLDLSLESVKQAKKLKCDTIVTHHPAIYAPLKNLGEDCISSGAVFKAIKEGLNVISMHLNLDMTDGGIDESLSSGLGGEEKEILSLVDDRHGYGRIAKIKPIKFSQLIANTKQNFDTQKVIYYGNKNAIISRVASFCGSGSGDIDSALKSGRLNADLVVSSDMPHHVISELVESGYSVLILTHYAAEDYGFKRFYEFATQLIKDKAKTYYFSDKRFK